MPTATGILSHPQVLREGENKNGPWKLAVAKVGNISIKTFRAATASQFIGLEGDTVEAEYEPTRNGEYTDNMVTSLKRVNGAEPSIASQQEVPGGPGGPGGPVSPPKATLDKDQQIARAVALKAAVDAVSLNSFDNLSDWLDQVQRVAEVFTRWLTFVPDPAALTSEVTDSIGDFPF